MSHDPDFQNLLAGLSVDPRGDQTPSASASGAGRGGGGIAGTAGAPPSQDEGMYLSEIEGQVHSVYDSIQSSVSFQAYRADQAPRSVHVSSMSLEQVISPVESM
eukprot:scaffold92836_cov32-Attheya_sp.AAC.2